MCVFPMFSHNVVNVIVEFVVGRVKGEWPIDVFFSCALEKCNPI